jgi:polyisoprenoid-binding protein YceI
MRLALAIAALALSAAGAPALAQSALSAPAGAYVSDPTHTSLEWRIKHQGLSFYTARFTKVDAQLDFNEADVSKSRLSVTIDPKSVETDYAKTRTDTRDFNAEIFGEQILNAPKFPTITFKSTKVTKTGADKGAATGDLTFLNVTKPVTLAITYNGNRPDPRSQKHRLGFSATTTIKRSDFGLTYGGAFLGDEVQIVIETEFRQK